MLLSCANLVLPKLAEMLAVDDSIQLVIGEVSMYIPDPFVELNGGHWS